MFRKLLKTIVPVSEIIFVLLQAYLLIRNRERYITSPLLQQDICR